MSLQRILEPEVMDTVEEAVDYNSMDHSEVNRLFVNDMIDFAKTNGIEFSKVLDLGTGTALIPIELCKTDLNFQVVAIDMAEQMLVLAKKNIEESKLQDRIQLQKVDAKGLPFDDGSFPAVMSNSIVHHIPEPIHCIRELVRATSPGGLVFVRDLLRPDTDKRVIELVEMYAGAENEHSKQMFDDSLRAALSLEEIRSLVGAFGFDRNTVTATSDRHWTWAAIKSGD